MGKYSYSNARERAEKHTGGFESTSINLPKGVKAFKVKKEGVMRFDIIPFVAGKGNPFADEGVLHYERTYYVHPRLGGDGDTYICPNKTAGLPCPICELAKKLRADDDADEELVKSLWPRERQLFQIIDINDRNAGIQIWDVSYHLFGKILDEAIRNADESDNYHRFYHVTKGFTLKVGFRQKKFGKQEFYEATTIEFKPRAEPYDESIVDDGHCLDDLLKIEDYETLKAAMDGASTKKKKSADDDDEDETPKKKARVEDDDEDPPVKKKKPADDDDEDAPPAKKKPADDDWGDEDPPAKKKAAPADDEDEDEDPPANKRPATDDEDETPPKKKKPVDDDEDETPPAKKKPADDDDEDWDNLPKKKKPAASEDDDEDPPVKKKPAPSSDDEDEDPPAKKKPKDDHWD